MAAVSTRSFKFGQIFINESVIFFKSKLSCAFVNIKPVVPGHVLVSTKRVTQRFADLTKEEVSDLFICTQIVSNVIKEEYKATSLSIAIQDGPDAGQTVPHVHVHILPRVKGDFEHNDDIYRKLEEHDQELGDVTEPSGQRKCKRRSLEDMTLEAKKLQSYFKQSDTHIF